MLTLPLLCEDCRVLMYRQMLVVAKNAFSVLIAFPLVGFRRCSEICRLGDGLFGLNVGRRQDTISTGRRPRSRSPRELWPQGTFGMSSSSDYRSYRHEIKR